MKNEKADKVNNKFVVGDPAVVYSMSQNSKRDTKDQLRFFDPTEFGLESEEPPLKCEYSNISYIDDDNNNYDGFSNRPSILI